MKKRMVAWMLTVVLALCSTVPIWAMPKELVPGGNTVGLKLYSEGLVIADFDKQSAARSAGLKKGDIIIRVDGKQIHTVQTLRENLDAEQIVLTVLRKGREAEFCVRPQENKIGAYVRDSISGIGTVTYYDPATGDFGALGHGVSETDTDITLPVEHGMVIRSWVEQVEKGRHGTPGELKGKFDVHRILGNVQRNTEKGIFGKMTEPVPGTALPVAEPADVVTGSATILSNVRGTEVQAYSVEILKIYPHAEDTGLNLLLQVTDEALLAQTGGIVQGMSGSPIIQNGKLIGAVTHVLVNDPTKGYGIFIENMLDAAA